MFVVQWATERARSATQHASRTIVGGLACGANPHYQPRGRRLPDMVQRHVWSTSLLCALLSGVSVVALLLMPPVARNRLLGHGGDVGSVLGSRLDAAADGDTLGPQWAHPAGVFDASRRVLTVLVVAGALYPAALLLLGRDALCARCVDGWPAHQRLLLPLAEVSVTAGPLGFVASSMAPSTLTFLGASVVGGATLMAVLWQRVRAVGLLRLGWLPDWLVEMLTSTTLLEFLTDSSTTDVMRAYLPFFMGLSDAELRHALSQSTPAFRERLVRPGLAGECPGWFQALLQPGSNAPPHSSTSASGMLNSSSRTMRAAAAAHAQRTPRSGTGAVGSRLSGNGQRGRGSQCNDAALRAQSGLRTEVCGEVGRDLQQESAVLARIRARPSGVLSTGLLESDVSAKLLLDRTRSAITVSVDAHRSTP